MGGDMTLNMHARLTADGKQAQAEIGKTSTEARELAESLGYVEDKAGRWRDSMGRFVPATERARVGLKNVGDVFEDIGRKAPRANQATSAFAGGGLRQMSMQFSQVAQQGAVTGNYLQALAVQAPDLALGFGTVGIAVGALVPIIFGLSQGLLDTGMSAEDAQKSIDVFLDTLSEVQGYTDTAKTSIKDLRREFGDFAREVQQASALAAQATVSLAFSEFDDAAKGIRADLEDVVRAIGDVARANKQLLDAQDLAAAGILGERQVTEAREALELLEDRAAKMLTALGLSAAEATRLDAAFDDLAKANSLAEVAEAASEAVRLLRGMYDESERIPDEVARIIQNLNSMVKAASAGAVAMGDTKEETGDAADEASRLAANILTAANNAIAFQQAMASLSIPFEDAMEELDFELATAGMNAADKLVATRVRRLEETMRAASERTFGFDYGLTDEQQAQLTRYEASLRNAAPTLTADKGAGGGSKATDKQRNAVQELIAAKRDELALLRESDPVQREMIRLREELAEATPKQREKIEKLIETYAAEEMAQAQLAETSEFFRSSMSDLIPDLVRGGDDAASAWQRFGRALEDAAWQALLLGEGPLMGLVNTLFGISGGGGGGLLGWIGGLFGFAEGGSHEAAGMHYGLGGPKSDRIPILTSAGEFTVNAKATQKHRPLLEAINAGAPIPGFAEGGAHGGGSYSPAPVEVQFELIDQTERGLKIERQERGDGRQPAFVASDMVDEAMNLPGGKARRSLRRKGLRDPMVRT
ncbi:hypothetical protein A9320_19265 [Ruegeria sp. PBVC088]|nr:hypothetical protein A9320_19265 [Ruegeria sp. PBVC088]